MVEPISLGTALALGTATAAGVGASMLMSSGNKSQQAPAPTPAAAPELPKTIIPAQSPTKAKPSGGGMQQSFLSGAAAAGLPGSRAGSPAASSGGPTTGKTLLGS